MGSRALVLIWTTAGVRTLGNKDLSPMLFCLDLNINMIDTRYASGYSYVRSFLDGAFFLNVGYRAECEVLRTSVSVILSRPCLG